MTQGHRHEAAYFVVVLLEELRHPPPRLCVTGKEGNEHIEVLIFRLLQGKFEGLVNESRISCGAHGGAIIKVSMCVYFFIDR